MMEENPTGWKLLLALAAVGFGLYVNLGLAIAITVAWPTFWPPMKLVISFIDAATNYRRGPELVFLGGVLLIVLSLVLLVVGSIKPVKYWKLLDPPVA